MSSVFSIMIIQCNECQGTGSYRGMAEPKGVAVVCLRCSGTGSIEFRYVKFEKRLPRTDIQKVYRSRGPTIMSCGPTGAFITYAEFERKVKYHDNQGNQ